MALTIPQPPVNLFKVGAGLRTALEVGRIGGRERAIEQLMRSLKKAPKGKSMFVFGEKAHEAEESLKGEPQEKRAVSFRGVGALAKKLPKGKPAFVFGEKAHKIHEEATESPGFGVPAPPFPATFQIPSPKLAALEKKAIWGLLARALPFLGRAALRVGSRVAPRYTARAMLPAMLRGGASRAVARFGGQAQPVLQRMLPQAMRGGRLGGLQTHEQMINAARLLRGPSVGQAAGRLGLGPLTSRLAPVTRPLAAGAPGVPMNQILGKPVAGGRITRSMARDARRSGAARQRQLADASYAEREAASAAGKAGVRAAPGGTKTVPISQVVREYASPQAWREAMAQPGMKWITGLSAAMALPGVMSGEQTLPEAAVSVLAPVPFYRAGTMAGVGASLLAPTVGQKLFGNAPPPPPPPQAPQQPVVVNMPPPPQMPVPPPPPMFQPGVRG